MLLDDDVAADGKAKASAFSSRLGLKNGLNIFCFTSGVMPVPLSRILKKERRRYG
jgi:hypothetical protein